MRKRDGPMRREGEKREEDVEAVGSREGGRDEGSE